MKEIILKIKIILNFLLKIFNLITNSETETSTESTESTESNKIVKNIDIIQYTYYSVTNDPIGLSNLL